MARYKKSARVRKIIMRRRIVNAVIIIALILGIFFGVKTCKNDTPNTDNPQINSSQSPSSDTPNNEPHIISTAKIGSTGDAIVHESVFVSVEDKNYDFSGIFAAAKPYYSAYDMMVVNLEVTFDTNENFTGYPNFNCPVTFADALKGAGVDMLLAANNHSYDNGHSGFANTLTQLKKRNFAYIGSRESGEKPYRVTDINGIKVGFICYTYSGTSGGNKTLNGHVMSANDGKLINTFDYSNLSAFYTDAKAQIADMIADGADTTVIYVHWGDEYAAKPNSTQKAMAQKLCDMGYDAIIGSHPHVIQEIETLKNEQGKETVCIYSLGNSISNQRKEILNQGGYTEDGVVFELTFNKYSDGTVKLDDVGALPTWVDLRNENGGKSYNIIPLDLSKDWTTFNVSSISDAKASYNRTLKRIGAGLNEWRTSHGKSAVPLTVE